MTLERRVWIGRIFMCSWILFAAPSVIQVLQSGGLGPVGIAVTVAVLIWGVLWVWFWARALGLSQEAQTVGLVAITVVVVALGLIAPPPVGVGGVIVFGFIVAGVAFPLRRAVAVLIGLSILQLVLMNVRQEVLSIQVSSLINSMLVGAVGVGIRLLWLSYNELLAAREEIGRLAVSEERLRFARDLHDILGQSLAMIVLKSELVARNLPADTDEAVRQEVYDVVGVARKSLNDVRDAVTGYRKPTLPGEISSARAALRAAGIRFVVTDELGAVPPDKDAVLAWCLREAVTNVVKHSGASRCELRLARQNGQASMSVTDDGRGAAELVGGSGIPGMRERVEIAGGTIQVAGHGEGGGLRLQVTVPAA